MKSPTTFQRAARRERKYPVLVALDQVMDWILRGALVALALAVLGWLTWLTAPSWSARIVELALQMIR